MSIPENRPRKASATSPHEGAALWTRINKAVVTLLADEQPAEREDEPYDLGILFIHGMGEQARGDTITQMGDAFTEWLRRWLGNERFRLKDANLRSREGAPAGTASPASSGRANATVILRKERSVQAGQQRWLLAESWWADAFRPASFSELAWWAIGVGPWLISGQLAGLRERVMVPGGSIAQWAIGWIVMFVLFVTAAFVAALVAPLVLLLLLISLIPIPVVGSIAQGLARNLAGSFGDLLVFVRSPVRFAAIAERVRQDIEWLNSRCDRIMLVAHSQGSAVAWHAIRRTAQADSEKDPPDRTQLAVFMTFGQAFRKLKALHRLHTRVGGGRQLLFAALAAASTLNLLVAGIAGYVAFVLLVASEGMIGAFARNSWPWLALVLLALVVVGVFQVLLSRLAAANNAKAQDLIVSDLEEVHEVLPELKWVDLWASADPASNGPLFSRPVLNVESYRIRNLASAIFDHSRYWSNMTEFVSAVAFRAASLAPGGPLGSSAIPVRVGRAALVRDRRVTALAAVRVAFAAALVALLIGLRMDLPTAGNWIVGFVDWVPFTPDAVKDWPGWVRGLLGGGLVVLIVCLAWWLLLAGWKGVIRNDESRFFARQAQPEWSGLAVLWAIGGALIPTVAVIAFAVVRDDATFFWWWAALSVLGLLVVFRLMQSSTPRLSDSIEAA